MKMRDPDDGDAADGRRDGYGPANNADEEEFTPFEEIS